jgi:hypothetical protein
MNMQISSSIPRNAKLFINMVGMSEKEKLQRRLKYKEKNWSR